MDIEDDFERSLMESLVTDIDCDGREKPTFVATKSATLYLDYDEYGHFAGATTDKDTADRLGGYAHTVEIQWNEERNEYLFLKADAIFSNSVRDFSILVSLVKEDIGMSLASALCLVIEMFKQNGIPFPSVKGSTIEWLIFEEQAWEDMVVGRLIDSQLISRTESTQ